MNYREIREANDLIDELKKIDSFIIDVQILYNYFKDMH